MASDVMGVSGRADPATMAELAKGRMRSKMPLLEQALTGLVRDHHRQLLAMQLAHIDFLDEQIDLLSVAITGHLTDLGAGDPPATPAETAGPAGSAADPGPSPAPMTFARAVTVFDTIPGVDQRGGELMVAEWGIDMARFGTAERLSAWSGVAPGNDESAGKQRSGKTRQGNRALRTGLTQLAHAAARTKDTYLSAWYHRLAARRGKKRAIMAVAHSIAVSAFHMLSRNEPYHELGANYFDEHRREHLVDRLTRRMERLGYRVSLELDEADLHGIRTPSQVDLACACGYSRPVVESVIASLLCRGAAHLTYEGHRGAIVQTGMAVMAHNAATLVRIHEYRLSKRARKFRRRLRLRCRKIKQYNASIN